MVTMGVVHNGLIVIDGGIPLPEGTRIRVSIEPEASTSRSASHQIEFPLVHSKTPGQLHLTNEMIAESYWTSTPKESQSVAGG